jgi:flagellar biosynthetic protein FlhB
MCVLPLAACSWGVAVAATVLQVGVEFRVLDPWPDFGRLGLRRAFARIVSLRSLMRGGFSMLKLVVVGGAVAWFLRGFLERIVSLVAEGGRESSALLVREAWGEWWRGSAYFGVLVSLLLVGLASLEYLYQRWLHERDLRMTKAEVEEENLRLQGRVQYKSLRSRAASMETQSVADADRVPGSGTTDTRRRQE